MIRSNSRFMYRAAAMAGVVIGLAPMAGAQKAPDFGSHVFVFRPEMPTAEMQSKIDAVYAEQQHSEFGKGRYAFLLMPGEYKLNVPVGFYTQVAGLGGTPDAVHLTGSLYSDAAEKNNNATTTFWRSAEGIHVTPESGTVRWAVSQAVSFRRMHVSGDMVLHQKGGWASGGWMSDTMVDGNVDSGPQQQWISRNSEWKSWTGSNWNMVFVGVPQAPAGEWPKPAYTKVAETPVVREKPFLVSDGHGRWAVRVPALARNSSGVSWKGGATAGRDVPMAAFYIAHPESDTAATMNAALRSGKHLLLTPGTYDLDEPIQVERKDAIVLGLGFATLRPTHGTEAMVVADSDGIIVSGILFDAGEMISPSLLRVGETHGSRTHRDDPISLSDVFFRDGGAGIGKTKSNLVIESNDVLVDHTWIWRADHGAGVGWTKNLSDNGLTVDGDDVTIYGLFVEHHQKFEVVWNGERGRTYFYQSEIAYDAPSQPEWTSAKGVNGWASYKVGDGVREHEAWGLGVYSVFRYPNVVLSRAIEVPEVPGVRFHHMVTVALDDKGEITHIINGAGDAATTKQPRVDPRLTEFPVR